MLQFLLAVGCIKWQWGIFMAEKWTLASFFAGIGGINLGFEESGKVKTIYANEFDPYAAQTYEQSFDLKVDGRDIHEVLPEEVPDADIFVGGFPCQAFSVAGYRQIWAKEDIMFKLGICAQFLSLSQCSAKPEAIVVSNVLAELQPRRDPCAGTCRIRALRGPDSSAFPSNHGRAISGYTRSR